MNETEEFVAYKKLFSILPDHQIRKLIYMREGSKDYDQSIDKKKDIKKYEEFLNNLYFE